MNKENNQTPITKKSAEEKSILLEFERNSTLNKKRNKENNNFSGRWTKEEHIKFVEAVIQYKNNWKAIEKCLIVRNSTQARSHAQKFFKKIEKRNILNAQKREVTIFTLPSILLSLKNNEYELVMKILFNVPFEKKYFFGNFDEYIEKESLKSLLDDTKNKKDKKKKDYSYKQIMNGLNLKKKSSNSIMKLENDVDLVFKKSLQNIDIQQIRRFSKRNSLLSNRQNEFFDLINNFNMNNNFLNLENDNDELFNSITSNTMSVKSK